jgi:hypothetical protein
VSQSHTVSTSEGVGKGVGVVCGGQLICGDLLSWLWLSGITDAGGSWSKSTVLPLHGDK